MQFFLVLIYYSYAYFDLFQNKKERIIYMKIYQSDFEFDI